MKPRIGDIAVTATPAVFVVLWASGFIGAKLGLPYAEPLTFLALRTGAVVVLIGTIIALTRPRWPSPAGIAHSAITGLLVHGLYLGGVFISIHEHLPAGVTALVVSLQPVLTSTLASRIFGERVVMRQWAGLALGLVGVFLVLSGKLGSGETSMLGWSAAVVGLLGITAGTIYQKRFGAGVDWRPNFLVQYASAGTMFAIAAFALETRAVQWTAEFAFALGWLVLVLSFSAVWLFYYLIQRSAASRVVSLFYLTPPVTALMAFALFDERLSPLSLIGMAICVAGVFLVNWRPRTA